MERKIEFRGKRCDNDEWIEGSLRTTFLRMDTASIFVDKIDRIEEVLVDLNTVGEFVGLLDKDGKKIYEGDIVTQPVRETMKHSKCIVEFIDGKFQSHYKSKNKYYDRYYDINSYTKIIGNIYDNKDLLD